MTTLSTDAINGLGGPVWLTARRTEAAEQATANPLPTAEEEVWRYSPIDSLDLERYAPGAIDTAIETGDLGKATVTRAADLSDGAALGDLPDHGDRLVWLHHALALDPIVIDVPAGVTVPDPIVIRHAGPADGVVGAVRLIVRAGADSEVRVVECFEGGGDGLLLPGTVILAGSSARVGYLGVQDLGRQVWSLGTLEADVEAQGSLTAGLAGFGGAYARVRTDCRLVGRGSSGDLLAAYFGDGDQTLDYRTFQDHVAPDTTSNLLFKGAVSDRSRSVYTGLIKVGKDARGTNAFQTNRNIKLSDDAWAESVPNLMIENNDVHCSHASAVGPIDEEQRFYLESRGVPTLVAERLIVGGFFDEVFEKLPATTLRPMLDAKVEAKLQAVLPA
ncbi:MAG: SufD family Fe-S cluster assembly protein [Actinomycetota bacterium]|nr:SufD family Fe-S cluster assembly protein [Actinomycetota bacterium]